MKKNNNIVARVWFKDKPSKFYHFTNSVKGVLAFVESMLPCKDVEDIQLFKTVEWLNDDSDSFELDCLTGVSND